MQPIDITGDTTITISALPILHATDALQPRPAYRTDADASCMAAPVLPASPIPGFPFGWRRPLPFRQPMHHC